MKIIRLAVIAVLTITFMITLVSYPSLPDPVVVHWNASGEPDGYMSKLPGLFLTPLIMVGLAALLAVLPRIDPLKENYAKFQTYYDGLFLALLLFSGIIQFQLILWNLGVQISPNLTFPIIFGILFIYIGFVLEHAEQNWFVGIRTPWTLSSETVWKKTHVLGGKLFKISGVICFIGILFPDYAFWFILFPILAVALYTIVFSYWEYQKEIHEPGAA
jgi:uncharacterized membrane protein